MSGQTSGVMCDIRPVGVRSWVTYLVIQAGVTMRPRCCLFHEWADLWSDVRHSPAWRTKRERPFAADLPDIP